MKYFLVLCFITTTLSLESSSEIQEKWNNYKINHQKTYHTQEEIKRFQIFQENVNKIEEHNKLYETNQVSYKMDINQFADLTSEEFHQYLNKHKSNNPQVIVKSKIIENVKALDEVDWRERGAVTPVRNEDVCSANWIAAIESVEGQNFLTNDKLITLSTQEAADCASKGCSTGTYSDAYKYMIHNGLASAEDYPSNGTGECQSASIPVAVNVSEYYTVIGDEVRLKYAVSGIGPITAEINATPWQFYTEGIFYDETCNSTTNHVILIAGYGIDKTSPGNIKYWIIKNSWGEHWGEQGYMRLRAFTDYGCGITELPTYPKVVKHRQ